MPLLREESGRAPRSPPVEPEARDHGVSLAGDVPAGFASYPVLASRSDPHFSRYPTRSARLTLMGRGERSAADLLIQPRPVRVIAPDEGYAPSSGVRVFSEKKPLPQLLQLPERCIFLIGGPLGAGKTSLAESLCLGDDLLRIDDFEENFGARSITAMGEKLSESGRVAIDAPAVFQNRLKAYSELSRQHSAPIYALYTGADVARINEAVIRRQLDAKAFHSYHDSWEKMEELLRSGERPAGLDAEWVGLVPRYELYHPLQRVCFRD